MNRKTIVILGPVSFIGLTLFTFYLFLKGNTATSSLPQIVINNKTKVSVTFAQSDEQKRQGLSGAKNLPDNEGMLFVYQNAQPVFWMVDMNFPLDIIWIDNGEIVQIDQNAPNPSLETPVSELARYYPPVPIDYVLEVNAGFTQKHQLRVGDSVTLP